MSQPTRTELVILKCLWAQSPLSARELHDEVGPQLDWSFSTTRTTLSRMVEKGLLKTEKRHGVRVYSTAQSKARILSVVMREFFEGVLEMEGPVPTAAFHESKMLNADEWDELDQYLNEDREQAQNGDQVDD